MPTVVTQAHPDTGSTPCRIKTFVENAVSNLAQAHNAIIASRVNQTYQANKHCRAEALFKKGDWAYLAMENLNLPKGRAWKLMPKYIGPYKVLKSKAATSITYWSSQRNSSTERFIQNST
jgi:hypothetical protein